MSPQARRAAAALIFVILNMRLAVAAIPPVVNQIEAETGLSSAAAGVLTAVPVFCFGAVALVTPTLLRRRGMSLLLLLTLVVTALGCAIRLDSTIVALFAGTAVLGAGIAVANVLVPGVIKRDFPAQAAIMVGLYSLGISLSGAISAGLTVPLEHLLDVGWRPAVAVWGIFAAFAALLWAPQARREDPPRSGPAEPAVGRALWRDRLAWNVTLFMGLQAFAFYATLSWLPTILEDNGMSQVAAGWALSFTFLPAMVAAPATPVMQRRIGWQPTGVVAMVVLSALAYLGLIADPGGAPYAWAALLGLGQGLGLTLALGFIVARAPDGHHAAHLSTMAQGGGYLVAASGPFLVGALHAISGGWTAPLILLLAALVPLAVVGFVACREGHVLARPATATRHKVAGHRR